MEAIFNANDINTKGVFIADKYQFEYLEKALLEFYNVMDEKELDARNTIELMLRKTKEVQTRYSQESLFTMEAQSKMINKALMSQHEQWVLNEW